ncbi:unnamed protein product [Kuraishia capsulata CBS 1993]|uniref:Glutamate pyruvate transaminase n=1 Tax=Kuraishia capsulata CBS 1993 TaxID=1382522 RepID=W6MKS7_9ASCO|nr:uncharacterized protein KUCA_T00001331001 [Kuraishia capsulata CBS 1993]CDK25362.1 unnamed protein product [Kuraishia capsulata CBS 1993]
MSYTSLKSLASKYTFQPATKLLAKDLNPHAINAKYAVRGPIPTKAEELRAKLAGESHSLPFNKIINANIGNPQQLDQKPLTFYRQVLAILQYPELIYNPALVQTIPKDLIERAKLLLGKIGSVGAYSHSQGIPYVREQVAKFIQKRDGYESDANEIFLTSGASTAVSYLVSILGLGQQTGFLIPIPQYPLYTATLTLNNSKALPYYLKEEEDWSIDSSSLRTIIENAIAEGTIPRCLVIINPGNPTGAILKPDAIANLLALAAEYGLVVIADEVYQENVFKGEFVSVKKILRELQEGDDQGRFSNVQLASLHSTSKGISGECGQRGGYMELVGFHDEVIQQLLKLASISLCPVVTGQALVELMINPPKKGQESYEQFKYESQAIFDSLEQRAASLYAAFNEMTGVSCQEPEGAMYCFPNLTIPQKAVDQAEKSGLEPDEFYCSELLDNTGICAVPGSGFGQVPGSWHVRTTFLAPGTEWIDQWKEFHEMFMKKYA